MRVKVKCLLIVAFLLMLSIPVVHAEQIWPNGGFYHARFGRGSIIVERQHDKELNKVVVEALRYWNGLAGWALFVQRRDREPEIRYVKMDCNSCAYMFPSFNEAYTHAQFYVYRYLALYHQRGLHNITHELGHTLGFSYETLGIMNPDHPRPDEIFDKTLLQQFGYSDGASSVGPPPE